jgi:sporulation protein YlmC with PRC-barrel domain
MATDDNEEQNCFEILSESEYEIKDGQPDIQGWDVYNSENHKIGEVDDLLFSVEAQKVCYIVLHMENNDIGLEDGRVLIPIGVAELHEKNDTVVVPVTKAQMLALPIYERGRLIDSETEAEIHSIFAGENPGVVNRNEFYDHDHFNETKFYGSRWKRSAEHDPNSADL